MRRTPIGLDVGSRVIKAVQLEPAPGTAGGMRVAAAVSVPRTVLMSPAGAAAGPGGKAGAAAPGARAFGCAPAVPTAEELAGLPDALERAGFSGRRAVLAAPAGGLMTSVLELPPRAGAVPARQIARMELARAHRCAPDSFEMGYWDLPPAGPSIAIGAARAHSRGTSVMAVGLPHGQANALLDAFDAAGLDVTAIDVGACALVRACGPLLRGETPASPAIAAAADAASAAASGIASAAAGAGEDANAGEPTPKPPPSKMMAILDLGWDTAMLWLVYNGSIIYGRPLADGGLGRLHESLVTRHGLEPDVADYLLNEVGLSEAHHGDPADAATADGAPTADGARRRHDREGHAAADDDARSIVTAYAEELVRELNVSFAYAGHEYHEGDVGRLLMVGGGAAMPALAGRLTDALGVPATPVTPAHVAACDPHLLAAGSPALTTAAGLALFPEAA